jgi:nicotinamide mononucleotide transporter
MLAHLLAPLNAVLFRLGNDEVTAAELLGFVTGAASVWLTVRARISNFGVGIANSAFFLVLFLSARLYADSGLQVVYIALGCAGWWQWLHGGQDRARLEVARAGTRLLAGCAAFVVKRLDLTALVYLLFLGLCAAGVTSWRRALRDSDQAPAPVSVVRSGGA